MTQQKVVLLVGGMAVLALATAGFLLRKNVVEWYWLKQLQSSDPSRRTVAAEELGRLATPGTLPFLLWNRAAIPQDAEAPVSFQGQEGEARLRAIARIYLEEPSETLPILRKALSSADASGRFHILRVLVEAIVCDEAIWPRLMFQGYSSLLWWDSVHTSVLECIRSELLPILAGCLGDESEPVRELAVKALCWAGDEGVRLACVALKDRSAEVRITFLREVYSWGHKTREIVPDLIECLKDPDSRVRGSVIFNLNAHREDDPDGISNALGELLRVEKDPKAQEGALRNLYYLESSGQGALVAALKSEDPHVRYFAAILLSKRAAFRDAALPILLDALRSNLKAHAGEEGFETAQGAIEALGSSCAESPAARALLREALGSGDMEFRYETARILARHEGLGQEVLPVLREMLETNLNAHPGSVAFEHAISAIKGIEFCCGEGPEGRALLQEALKSEDEDIRDAAAEATR